MKSLASFLPINLLPFLGDSPDVGRTPLLSYLRKCQFSVLPITSKKRICVDLGDQVCDSRMVRSSEERSQEAWRLPECNN